MRLTKAAWNGHGHDRLIGPATSPESWLSQVKLIRVVTMIDWENQSELNAPSMLVKVDMFKHKVQILLIRRVSTVWN
jgi:hypothetical protein